MTQLIGGILPSLAVIFYKHLVSLYPKGFRNRFDEEMVQVFIDWLAEQQGSPPKSHLALEISHVLIDVTGSIVKEYFVEWRLKMKAINNYQKAAVAALVVWLVLWIWYLSIWIFRAPLMEPVVWLFGENYNNAANNLIGGIMFLVPFAALLTFLIPSVKIQNGIDAQDAITVRLYKMSKLQSVITWSCLAITIAMWGVIFSSWLGLW